MDLVLNKLGNQPDLKFVNGLLKAIQEARSTLQKTALQCAPFEKREKCLDCFGIALAAGRPKYAAIAFEGIQLLLRDHSVLGSEERSPEGGSRAEQLLSLLAGIPSWRDAPGTQCQALTLMVQLISSSEIALKYPAVLAAIETCKLAFDSAPEESTSVRPAARAALTQMLNSYVQNRLILAENEIAALMDINALLGELIARMGIAIGEVAINQGRPTGEGNDPIANKNTQPLLLPLDALFSVLSALEHAQLLRHQPLFNSLKNELLPVVICHLYGSARMPSAAAPCGPESGPSKIGLLLRRAGRQCADSASIAPMALALEGLETIRSFYQVVEQLLRLFAPLALSGPILPSAGANCPSLPPAHQLVLPSSAELLSLLEELWRSALLSLPSPKRGEALRLCKRLCGNRSRFCELLRLTAASGTNSFWLLLVECLEECCGGGEPRLAADSVRTLSALLTAISQLISSSDNEFNDNFFEKIVNSEGTKQIDDSEDGVDNANNAGIARKKASIVVGEPANATVRVLLDSLPEQMASLEECRSAAQMDLQLQDFVNKMTERMKDCADADKRQSTTSTPEDSEEEQELEGIGRRESAKAILTPLDIYSISVGTLVALRGNGEKEREQQKSDGEPPLLQLSPAHQKLVQQLLNSLHNQSTEFSAVGNFHRLMMFSSNDPLAFDGEPENENVQQNVLLCRWLRSQLSNCWGSFLNILTRFPMRRGTSAAAEEGKFAAVEAIALVVPLAIRLGMSSQLEWALETVGEQVCVLEELREAVKRSMTRRSNEDTKPVRRFCGRPEILAMQLVMENAAEGVRLAPKGAKHVIRCVQFLWELERWHFKLAKASIDAIYEPPSLPVPPSASGHNSPIGQLVGPTVPSAGELSSTELARLMDQFLALIDLFLSNAASQLPVDSFCALLDSICSANEDNLCYSGGMAPLETCAELLRRVCQMLCAKRESPLTVKLCVWSRVKDHLVQCASSKTIPPEIARRAVDGLQEVLTFLLHLEWGEPAPKKDGKLLLEVAPVAGWNALLFDVFPRIVCQKEGEVICCCSPETGQQVGQVLLAFEEQCPELVGTGWTPFFQTVKLLSQLSPADHSADSCPGLQLSIDIVEKFLAIQRPSLLLPAIPSCNSALVHLLALLCSGTVQVQDAGPSPSFDHLLSLLDRSVNILLNYLFGSVIPLAALPKGMFREEDANLAARWTAFQCNNRKIGEHEGQAADYLELLADLRTMLSDQLPVQKSEWALLRKWLDGDAELHHFEKDQKVGSAPWANLRVPTDRVVASFAVQLLDQLMDAILSGTNLSVQLDKRDRLALKVNDILKAISSEIGGAFSAFCACASPLASLRRTITSPLDAANGRALKQFIGIISSHESLADGLLGGHIEGEWAALVLATLLDLAVKCSAKGGSLSLAGCALLRRLSSLFPSAEDNTRIQRMRALCATGIWFSSRYSLFPIRMLVAQFFVNSNDFSGDLGQMRVSYRLGLSPSEVEERVDNVHQLASQVFQFECLNQTKAGEEEEKAEKSSGGAHFPSKFAYLFIFESHSHGDGTEGTNKKLSMGLDELVDSLVCHQLLVQLAAEQLDGGGKASDLAKSESLVHGPLLATLTATLFVCEQFEQRPGLRSLLQKLTGLPNPANLWTLALPALQSLASFYFRQAIGGDGQGNGVHIVGQLLERVVGGRARYTTLERSNPSANQNSSSDDLSSSSRSLSFSAAEQQRPIRANPFINPQPSIEAAEHLGKTLGGRVCASPLAEDQPIRLSVFAKLIASLVSSFGGANDPNSKREREMRAQLAAELHKTSEIYKENEEIGKAVEEAATKLLKE